MDVRALDILWVLVAAVLVMFMQAGFSMVEVGFTRAKNAGNIMMKNFMDFIIGTLFFWALGYNIMYGGDGAFIGSFSFFFNDATNMHSLFFQTVFVATAATIVSGAVAERTLFSTYLVVSLVISTFIYPISGHWIWGGGWLSQLGFIDFAGSTAVHLVGGAAGLVGAAMVGPRIGKYNGKTNAIPGHNLVLGGLGVFILWLGWFGFNPGSQLAISGDNADKVSMIFITTNLAAAAGGLLALITSWVRYGKPDISMTFNGVLAGLVAITAGTAAVNPFGAVAIGALAGVVVVFSVEFLDKVLKIDDPVGAISVHGICGALGTILVGFFAVDGGLFYGGGAGQLGVQAIGVLAVTAWTLGTSFVLFFILKKTIGIRVPSNMEREGLDIHEHGTSAYN
jgi:ammonium transporter, Amt family